MKPSPPKRALKFLRWFCREDYIEEIEGDLVELYEKRCSELTPKKANWWFVWDVIRSFRLRNIKDLKISDSNYLMLLHYLKIGRRNLLKNKGYSLINITGLSVGTTCCLILFIFVRYESGFESFHARAHETYRVVQQTKLPEQTLYWNTTAYPLAEALRSDFHEFELVTQAAGPIERFFTVARNGADDLHFKSSGILYVDPYYPEVFDLKWVSGDPQTALLQPNSIVLTETIVRKCFGDDINASVLGKTVMLNGKDPLQVTGVIKDAPGNTNLRYDILIPYEFFRQNNPYPSGNWSGNYQGTTFVVLPDEGLREKVESNITAWKKKYLNPVDDQRISYLLQPLKEIHTETLYGSSPGGYTMPENILHVATSVGIFILLIAIANFINLVTAKSASRAREVGVRKVIGSAWFDLIRQFMVENALVVVLSIVLAVGLTVVLLGQLNIFLSPISLQLEFQWGDAALILCLAALAILLSTIYPAVVLSSFKPLQIMKNSVHLGGTHGFTLRKSLIVFQFFIVQLFIIASIVVATQMNYFNSKELGFSSDAVVMVPAPEFDKLDVFRNSLLQNSGVDKVSFGSGPPMAVNGFALGTRFRLPDQPEEQSMEAEMKIGDLNYLAFYDLHLISGRNFTANRDAFDEFIVNERLLKSFGWTPEDAVGRKLTINEGEATIVGVVKDYHNISLQHDITPCIILNWNYFLNQAFVSVRDVNPSSLQAIEGTWRETFSTGIFQYDFLDDAIEKEYLIETLFLEGFTLFSIVVIIIGCLGLIGLMTFMTLRRTKEVGIRKVLGASVLQIIGFFTREFIVLIALAFVLAIPVAYYFMKLWLEGFIHRIDLSAWMFLGGGAVTLIITIATLGFQVTRAAVANPVESLRPE